MGFKAGIGQSDFRSLRRDHRDMVDKSALIVELVNDPAQTVLFPRPRRFGKTTNLSMLRYFFERSPEDRSYLFEDMQVWQS
ncbi:MAG: AAA family ATPase, partial [Myxococcota bacterium]